jgi:hypothetical protein
VPMFITMMNRWAPGHTPPAAVHTPPAAPHTPLSLPRLLPVLAAPVSPLEAASAHALPRWRRRPSFPTPPHAPLPVVLQVCGHGQPVPD